MNRIVTVATSHGSPANLARDAASDIIGALLALGYNDREATAAIKDLPPGTDVSAGIRHALKRLSPT